MTTMSFDKFGSAVDRVGSEPPDDEASQLLEQSVSTTRSNIIHTGPPQSQKAESEKSNRSATEATETTGQNGLQAGLRNLGLFHTGIAFMGITCIGHPFMQFEAVVDTSFLRRHGIKMGRTYVFPRESPLLSDFMRFVRGSPKCGGDAVKIAEAAQWALFYPKSAAFLGAVGGDGESEEIIYYLHDMELAYKMQSHRNMRTSIQLVIRHGRKWAEVYMFDNEACNMSLSFIDKPKVTSLLELSQFIIICGTSCLELDMSFIKLAFFASSRFKTLSFNLCEGINIKGKEKTLLSMIKYMDIFFLSRKTALMLIAVFNIQLHKTGCWRIPTEAIVECISEWVMSVSRKPRTVIIYEGVKEAYVDDGKKSIIKYSSKFYSSSNVVDLYGYENAFCGGYMAQMVQRRDIEECLDSAFFCASAVATQMGAQFPVNRLELVMLWRKQDEEQQKSSLPSQWQRPISVFRSSTSYSLKIWPCC